MDLEPGEHIIFQGHPSWRSILGFYIKGLVLVALGGAVAAVATKVADDEVDSGLVTLVVIVNPVVTSTSVYPSGGDLAANAGPRVADPPGR